MEKLYRRWRSRYLQYYDPRSENAQASDLSQGAGALRVSSTGDLSADVRRREEEFCDFFLNWLATDEAAIIERAIWPVANQNIPLDIYLSCDHERLLKLPWEIWARHFVVQSASPDAVRLIRTTEDDRGTEDDRELLAGNISTIKRSGKPRILAVIAQEPELEPFLEKDLQALKKIERAGLANIESFRAKEDESKREVIHRLCETIRDDRGWDGLLFVGHSDDKTSISGAFQLRPNIVLFMKQLAEPLRVAQSNGLRLAIFNSCSGLLIAESLIKLGIQAVVMREPIRSDVALAFLQQLCEGLCQKQDVHEAVIKASEYLKVSGPDSSEYPSAYLLPSFFSPSTIVPFQLEDYGWQKPFKRWGPTRREATTLIAACLIGSQAFVQQPLTEVRQFIQAVFRDVTGQRSNHASPVNTILINQAALNERGIEDTKNINRGLLADVTQKSLEKYQPGVLGYTYQLSNSAEGDIERLFETIESAAVSEKHWFIFPFSAAEEYNKIPDELDQYGVEGEGYFRLPYLDIPANSKTNKQECSYSYLVSLAHVLKQEVPTLKLTSLKREIQSYLHSIKADEQNFCRDLELFSNNTNLYSSVSQFIESVQSIFGWQQIIDFSIPPSHAYHKELASNLLEEDSESSKKPESSNLNTTIVIIGRGLYGDYKSNTVNPPLAVDYWWCDSSLTTAIKPDTVGSQNIKNKQCNRNITKAELYSYSVYNLTTNTSIIRFSDVLAILITGFLGKALSVYLTQFSLERRRQALLCLIPILLSTIVISLQIYVSVRLLVPILVPGFVLFKYLLPIYRSVFHVQVHFGNRKLFNSIFLTRFC
ncbi:hypothetical protein DXZ20_24290 [Leptolyngbyaceae cyanobacterium CCMR0081]|uniref:CHAT domain-containing protein n=2 Tax=Adonisia TaxID=2950183 RepID=A0A6M0RS94_9CYAN|nr:hypothetical protein [Adonisia turfae CCMR0081]